jgi:hypothetical protein
MLQRLSEVLYFFRNNFVPIARFVIPISIAYIVIAYLLMLDRVGQPSAMGHFSLMFLVATYPIYVGAEIYLIAGLAQGESRGLLDCLHFGLQNWVNLTVILLITGLAVFFGLLALIIPGLIAYSRLGFSPFISALEKQGPFEALQESIKLTQPYMWQIIGASLIIFLGLIAITLALNGVARAMPAGYVFAYFASIVSDLLGTLPTILLFRYYTLAKGY